MSWPRNAGLPNPLIGNGAIDEAGRYGIYAANKKKPVALFATERQANEAMDRPGPRNTRGP